MQLAFDVASGQHGIKAAVAGCIASAHIINRSSDISKNGESGMIYAFSLLLEGG